MSGRESFREGILLTTEEFVHRLTIIVLTTAPKKPKPAVQVSDEHIKGMLVF